MSIVLLGVFFDAQQINRPVPTLSPYHLIIHMFRLLHGRAIFDSENEAMKTLQAEFCINLSTRFWDKEKRVVQSWFLIEFSRIKLLRGSTRGLNSWIINQPTCWFSLCLEKARKGELKCFKIIDHGYVVLIEWLYLSRCRMPYCIKQRSRYWPDMGKYRNCIH